MFNPIAALKAYFTVKSTGEEIIKEAKMQTATGKPGWKTTEFWMNLAGQIGVLWGAVHGFIPQPWATILSVSGIAVYTVARTISKAVSDIHAAKSGTTTTTVAPAPAVVVTTQPAA